MRHAETHLHFRDDYGSVGAVLKMDSIFSLHPQYVILKNEEYEKILLTKDITRPFEEKTLLQLDKILTAHDEVDSQLFRCVLRSWLCIKAIDEYNLPYSKEEQVEKIMSAYNVGIINSKELD